MESISNQVRIAGWAASYQVWILFFESIVSCRSGSYRVFLLPLISRLVLTLQCLVGNKNVTHT